MCNDTHFEPSEKQGGLHDAIQPSPVSIRVDSIVRELATDFPHFDANGPELRDRLTRYLLETSDIVASGMMEDNLGMRGGDDGATSRVLNLITTARRALHDNDALYT